MRARDLMPFGWDKVLNKQTEPETRAAVTQLLTEKPRELALAATMHKAVPAVQHYLHTMFYRIDTDRELQVFSTENLRTVVPEQFIPGFVSPWLCPLPYPAFNYTGDLRDLYETHNIGLQRRTKRGPAAVQAICGDMVIRTSYFRAEREGPTASVDAIWAKLASKNISTPWDGVEAFPASDAVILTAVDTSIAANVAGYTRRFLVSLNSVRCTADVVMFVDEALCPIVLGTIRILTQLRVLTHVNVSRVFVLPVAAAVQDREPLWWRYLLWGSFLSRHLLRYTHSLHVFDVRAQFYMDPFAAVALRGGLAVFGHRVIPESIALNTTFMDAAFGHCWMDQYSVQRSYLVDDSTAPGTAGNPPWEPAVPPGKRLVLLPKYFWAPMKIVAGVAMGTVHAHLNLLVLVNNAMGRGWSAQCGLEQMVQRMVYNLDVGVAYPFTAYSPAHGPVFTARSEDEVVAAAHRMRGVTLSVVSPGAKEEHYTTH